MDIQFYGANCIVLQAGNARIVIDDNLAALGGKSVAKPGDIALYTANSGSGSPVIAKDSKLSISMPGEYEVSDVSIYGIAARSHVDEPSDKLSGQRSATMYKLIAKDLRVLITGHVFPKFKESDFEQIGVVDVMIVPVGGNGFTLDPVGAMELIKEIEPKLIIPTYYDDPKLNFPVPAQTLEQALHGLGMEPKDRTAKLRLKPSDLGEDARLIVLEKS